MNTMKRHEWWRHYYRQNRDLDHLSPEELSERLHDCINNIRTRTERGKLGLLDVKEPHGETWATLFTEILEECVLRGYPYPGPISIAAHRSSLDHAFDPIPDIEPVLKKYNLRPKSYLLKFGDSTWLSKSYEKGKFRVASASYYDRDEHNHARKDKEQRRFFRLNPKSPHYIEGQSSVSSPTDYLLFCLSAAYSSRLFGDFNSDACLVIFNPHIFLNKIIRTAKQRLPDWKIEYFPVTYFDPVRVSPHEIVIPKFKPFRHAYQNEMRIVCMPPVTTARLEPVEIEMGSLSDCATLVDLNSHPPVRLPPDPKDHPLQTYGNLNLETAMVNHLPDAARIQGIQLNKSASDHKDWYFLLQYTDDKDHWHQLQIPMLDGLYLLNLLSEAEKDQHLGLWNRR